jgi:hypothetical protein
MSVVTRMYEKCTAVRFAVHVPRGDRYVQHCFFWGGIGFVIERFPFAKGPAWVKGSCADSPSGFSDSGAGDSEFEVCFRRLRTLRCTRYGRQWAKTRLMHRSKGLLNLISKPANLRRSELGAGLLGAARALPMHQAVAPV